MTNDISLFQPTARKRLEWATLAAQAVTTLYVHSYVELGTIRDWFCTVGVTSYKVTVGITTNTAK